MKKKHAVGRFIVLAVICTIILALTIFSFKLPGDKQDYDFLGFARAINLGIEYQGGTLKEYTVKNNSTQNKDLQTGITNNVTRLKYLLDNDGYNTNVYQNNDNIVIEFFDEYNPISIDEIINAKVNFAIKTEQSDTAEAVVSASDIETCYATKSGTQNVLVMTFTKDGANNFQKVIDKKTAYFYIGSNSAVSVNVENATNTYLGITVQSMDIAKNYASQIVSSKYDMSFENILTTSYTKADANKNTITAILLVVALLALCILILCLVFNKLGLVASFILLFGVLFQIMLLQAIPTDVFVLTGPALFASLLCLTIGALTEYMMLNKMKDEYKMGKILYASVKFGFNKIWATMLDMYLVLLFPSVITYFFGSYLVKQFAMALMAGLAVYGLTTLLLTWWLTKMFTNVSFKAKDYGFKREAHVDELK